MTYLEKRGTFVGPRGKIMGNLANLTLSKYSQDSLQGRVDGIVGLSLGLFLPPAIAYFPQRAKVSSSKLEKEFQSQDDELYFNKGL